MTTRFPMGEVLDHFAKTESTPGDWWAFSDDQSTLCLQHDGENRLSFWLDLNRDGTIQVLWRESKDSPVYSAVYQQRDGAASLNREA